uniref:CD3 epsilon subunit of T-cell receptor complex n=1 Tax=Canis lupus familiaris TaxID=9615 RepID=A0A8I3MGF0_CANLF
CLVPLENVYLQFKLKPRLLSYGVFLFSCSDDLTSISPEKRFKVSISGTEVVVTCPDVFGYDNIKWEKNDNLVEGASNRELSQKEFSEVDDSGYYACYADSVKEKSYLYLRARVCANCIEVNLMAVVTIIVADICLTLGLLLMVYYWSKTRKANAKPVMRGTGAGSRPRGKTMELSWKSLTNGDVQPGPGWVASPQLGQDNFYRTFTVWPNSGQTVSHLRLLLSFLP